MYNKPTHALLIVGNGFDLDLGLPTRYSDFRESPEWLALNNVFEKLYEQWYRDRTIEDSFLTHLNFTSWSDVEEEIGNYVSRHPTPNRALVGLVREQHKAFKKYFMDYLQRVAIPQNVNKQSLAKDFTLRLTYSKCLTQICTFNYTNIFDLCGSSKKENVREIAMHGSINQSEIIVGCRAEFNQKENKDWDFLYKSYERPKSIVHDGTSISFETEIIFFGHSLNKMDACYFEDLFNLTHHNVQEKHLTIICWNEEDELKIRNNISKWIDEILFYPTWNVKFLHTKGWYEKNEDDIKIYLDLCNRLKIK